MSLSWRYGAQARVEGGGGDGGTTGRAMALMAKFETLKSKYMRFSASQRKPEGTAGHSASERLYTTAPATASTATQAAAAETAATAQTEKRASTFSSAPQRPAMWMPHGAASGSAPASSTISPASASSPSVTFGGGGQASRFGRGRHEKQGIVQQLFPSLSPQRRSQPATSTMRPEETSAVAQTRRSAWQEHEQQPPQHGEEALGEHAQSSTGDAEAESRTEESSSVRSSDTDEYLTAEDDSGDSVGTYAIENDNAMPRTPSGSDMSTGQLSPPATRPRPTLSTQSPKRLPRRQGEGASYDGSPANVTVWEREDASQTRHEPAHRTGTIWSGRGQGLLTDPRATMRSHTPPTLQERERAATIIQAAWRGFVIRATDPDVAAVRREIRTRRMEDHIVALHRQVDTLRAEVVREQELRAMQQEAMHAIWDKARVLAAAVEDMQRREHTRAALVLQKHVRGWLVRKRYRTQLCDRLRNNMTMMARNRAAIVGGDDRALRETVLHLQDQMYALKTTLDRAMVNTAWGAARNRSNTSLLASSRIDA